MFFVSFSQLVLCKDPQVASQLVHLDDTRVKLRLGHRAVGKEPDAATVSLDLLPKWDQPDLSGSIIWEGGVGNEDERKINEEMFLWMTSTQVRVGPVHPVHITDGQTACPSIPVPQQHLLTGRFLPSFLFLS